MSGTEKPIPQAAAIPFRETTAGTLEVLITRREDKQKWGIPKGIIDPGHDAHDTVRIESEEEAGIAGRISQQPIGSYDHHKWGTVCHIQVYLMRVTQEFPTYLEQEFRERKWIPHQEAAGLMGQKPVRELMTRLPELIARATFIDT
jgi:phosphohistidine phosphatase